MCAAPYSKERFKPGDHLAVSRWLYQHHGVYVGDERVVQFGGRILDKPRNCETVALWCATGVGESMQRQRFQVVNVIIGAVAALYTSWLFGRRRDRLTPRRITLIWAWTLLRMIPLGIYYLHNYRFYRDVRGACDQL